MQRPVRLAGLTRRDGGEPDSERPRLLQSRTTAVDGDKRYKRSEDAKIRSKSVDDVQ
jgi:hypothetical protein